MTARIFVLVLMAFSAFAQVGPRQLFERARLLDEKNQNLAEAIRLYSEVVSQAKEQRALAAQAQLRVALLYERLGRKAEAQRAFRAVLTDFADQADVVRQARERITDAGVLASSMAVRRVWAGHDVDPEGTPSPDGRYLSFVDWDTGDLALRDLAAGTNRRLTNKGSWWDSEEYALLSAISSDGKYVAYSWFNKDLAYDLRVIPLNGEPSASRPRVLYSNPEVYYIEPDGWSPDGKQILAVFWRRDGTNQIAFVSVADGSARILKTLDWRFPVMRLSPDGRYVAYDFPPREDSSGRDIFLLSADGKREIPLVQHPANDLLLGWAPDGSGVLFASDRTGTTDAWIIRIADGKPLGEPELVKKDIGRIVPLGFSRNGSFYYGALAGLKDVYVATLDPATGKVLDRPTNVSSERFAGTNAFAEWSRDGKQLVYVSERGGGHWAVGSRTMVIRSRETGEERELTPRLVNPHRLEPHWSPDGRFFLASGRDTKGRNGIYRIDAQTGDVTSILQTGPEPGDLWTAVGSADGKAIFYQRQDRAAKVSRILVHDIETGRERELYQHQGSIYSFTVSPDTREMAFALTDAKTQSGALVVMPTSGGEAREILRLREPEWFVNLAWTPDSGAILFAKQRTLKDSKLELWRVSAEGGTPTYLGLAMDGLGQGGLSVHPDGRRIAFIAGQVYEAEVWVMENFLPALRAAR